MTNTDSEFLHHMHNVTLQKFTMDQLITFTKLNYPLSTHKSERFKVFIIFIHEQVDTFMHNMINVNEHEIYSRVKSLKIKISAVHACLTINANVELEILKFMYSRTNHILQSEPFDVDHFFQEEKTRAERDTSNKSEARKKLYEVLEKKMTEIVIQWITHHKYLPGSSTVESLKTEFSTLSQQ